jgi:pentatricopeptide repeat protein
MWSRAVRTVNFFSPQRKALRDSAFRVRMQKYRELNLQKRVGKLEASNPQVESRNKYANEEVIRKNPRIRRMIARPTAQLPRKHHLFIKSGSVPLSLEDLSVAAPSIFDESRIHEILKQQTKIASESKDESWLFTKQPKKGLKLIEWKGPSPSTSDPKSDLSSKVVLGPRTDTIRALPDSCLTSTASNLISLLKERAVVYSQTGIDPDLLESVKKAMEEYPGMERRKKFEALSECQWTVESLVSQGRCSVENFNLLIRAFGFQKKVDEAFAVHDSMLKLGFDTNPDTYVSLIIASGTDAGKARSAYLLMREQLIAPTEKVYGALIKAHVKSGDLTSAFALLAKMEDEGMLPSSPIIYTTLLDGLVKANKTDVAWTLFRSWRTWRRLQPDSVMFTVMIRACTKKQECEQALAVLDDLRVSGEYPTDITYSHIIECMSTRPDFAEKAFEFHCLMMLEGFEMNSIVAKSLIRASAQLGDLNRLRKSVKQICAAGIPLSSGMYADSVLAVANSLSRTSTDHEKMVNIRLAWYFVSDLREKGLKISTPVLNSVMRVYLAAGQLEQAVNTLSEFEALQVAPNSETYEILLMEYGKRSEVGKFFALFDQTKSKISPDLFHVALDMAIESRSSKQTVAVLESMLERNIRPLPAASEKLAVVGRKIVQIHQVIGKMVAQNRDETHERTSKEHALLNLEIEEHRTRIAMVEGKSDLAFETPENEAKRLYWSKQDKRKNPKLARKDYLEVKKKGGAMHALKSDKPRSNLLADHS